MRVKAAHVSELICIRAAIIEIKAYQTFDSCLTEREIGDNRETLPGGSRKILAATSHPRYDTSSQLSSSLQLMKMGYSKEDRHLCTLLQIVRKTEEMSSKSACSISASKLLTFGGRNICRFLFANDL